MLPPVEGNKKNTMGTRHQSMLKSTASEVEGMINSSNRCPQSFSSQLSYKKHRRHDLAHSCRDCGKEFSSLFMLGIHELSNHSLSYNQASTICQYCSIDFEDPTTLFLHLIRIHKLKELNFNCLLCNATFEFKRSFDMHMRNTHNKQTANEINYIYRARKIRNECYKNCGCCLSCKNFARRLFEPFISGCSAESIKETNMNSQVVITIEGKVYSRIFGRWKPRKKPSWLIMCPQCHQLFTYNFLLFLHLIHKHNIVYPEKRCCKKFITRSDKFRHIYVAHNRSLRKCKICWMPFSSKLALLLHTFVEHRYRANRFACVACKNYPLLACPLKCKKCNV